MMRPPLTLAVVLVCLASGTAAAGMAERVVSMDYCADQFILKLLPRDNILAVSSDAGQEFSYMREASIGLPQVRPVAEDILAIEPDLVIRTYGGGARALEFFDRVGINVVQVPYANTVDDVRRVVTTVARELGVPQRGIELVREMDTRLAAIKHASPRPSVLYMTTNGVTSGTGTLINDMLSRAGLTNFEQRAGWHPLPLERLAFEQPDTVAAAFFDMKNVHPARWSAMRHPVAQRQLSLRPTVMLQGAWTSCGAWYLLDAIEALAEQ